MDRETVDVYEREALEWHDKRLPANHDKARAFAKRVMATEIDGPVIDLGCGPGWFTPDLAQPVIALDAARAMLALVPEHAPSALRVQADLSALPFRRLSLRAAWASKSYVHLARSDVPRALAELHRTVVVNAPFELSVFAGEREYERYDDDDFPGRRFSEWQLDLLANVVIGAGFSIETIDTTEATRSGQVISIQAKRAFTLADTVGPAMRVLVCGLNPSTYAADAGVGFARPGNRFWPAALRAGLVSRDRDPMHALDAHGVGMTDLVKRATERADALTTNEYRTGIARIERLSDWLKPRAVCFVGLTGWRAAVDRRAKAGIQDRGLAGTPVYVMPSTSGANASATLDQLTDHLRATIALANR